VTVKQTIQRLLADGVNPYRIVRIAADGWSAGTIRTVAQNVTLPQVGEDQTRWWFIDEITAAKGDWASQIKWLRDNDEWFRKSCVILTGSNAQSLSEASGVLAGRRGNATDVNRTLLPIGFRTFATQIGSLPGDLPQGLSLSSIRSAAARDAFGALIPWLDELVRLWELYLLYGGFPTSVAAARRGNQVPPRFVDDLIDVIARDAFGASKLDTGTTMALVSRLWEGLASPANLTKIGEAVGVSRDVATRHVLYLRDAYLLWHCHQRSDNSWTARTGAQAKIYAIDPLIARLAHLKNGARPDVDLTVLSEMMAGMAIRRRALNEAGDWLGDEFLFYERTPTKREIDFVSDYLGGAAVEGKYVQRNKWRSEAVTVNASAWKGIITTMNVLDCSEEHSEAWAVPGAFFSFLVDT
jgi:predicted AAA+ superfamily ATPase